MAENIKEGEPGLLWFKCRECRGQFGRTKTEIVHDEDCPLCFDCFAQNLVGHCDVWKLVRGIKGFAFAALVHEHGHSQARYLAKTEKGVWQMFDRREFERQHGIP